MTLPERTKYYYNGILQSYSNLENILQANTSIIFAYNDNKTDYDYALVIDPIYGKPEIVKNFAQDRTVFGDIKIDGGIKIFRKGEYIERTSLFDNNVIYEVTDLWGQYRYILAVDNYVNSRIKSITPNVLSPRSIEMMNGFSYEISRYADLEPIMSGKIKVGYWVIIFIGYDGKVAGIQ